MNDKRSILIFCDITSGGGVYVYTKNLIDILLEKGFSFYLVTHDPVTDGDRKRLEKMKAKLLGYHSIPNGINDEKILEQITTYLNKIKPDFYMPNYRDAPHAAIIGAKKAGSKVIYVAHNDHYDQYKFAVRYQNLIDFFISPSKKGCTTLVRILQKENSSRVSLIPHFVALPPPADIAGQVHQNKLRLLYCGRVVYEQKQLYFLPLIAEELQKRNIQFHINIVGEGDCEEALKKDFMRLGADQHVTFFGYVPHEQISHYFHENDVSILVSSYEGFCLGLAEAMSYGLPGVAFSCGGVINDYLLDGETGYLVGQGDTAAFADRLTLLLDPQRYEKLSKNAQTITSEHFNQDSIAERYRAILACTDDLSSGAWPGLRPPLANKNKIEMIIERVGCRLLKWPTLSSHQLDH